MICDLGNCKDEFVDTQFGLAELMLHKLAKHKTEDINTDEQMYDTDTVQIRTKDEDDLWECTECGDESFYGLPDKCPCGATENFRKVEEFTP